VHGGKLRRQKTAERIGGQLTVQEVLSAANAHRSGARTNLQHSRRWYRGTGVVDRRSDARRRRHVDGYFSSNLDITGLAQSTAPWDPMCESHWSQAGFTRLALQPASWTC